MKSYTVTLSHTAFISAEDEADAIQQTIDGLTDHDFELECEEDEDGEDE